MSRIKHHKYLNIVEQYMTEGIQKGYCYLSVEDDELNGRTIKIHGQDLINFGSGSYLGLETDRRLIDGAIEGALRYGTQFSSSRAYVASGQHSELEALLAQIFNVSADCVIVLPSTTLAHMSAIPVTIESKDVIVLDRHVHNTVRMAVNLLKSLENSVEAIEIPHNRLDILEQKIKELRNRASRIWYMIDSIYSMHGDISPLKTLEDMLNDYEQLYVYVDDAHGMSWKRISGRGYTLDTIKLHSKMVIATSLNKSFGAAGGALVFPEKKWSQRVRTCGEPLIFTGPIQPPLLGACIASAKVHLSDEIRTLQSDLLTRIKYCNELLKKYNVPIEESIAPIFFVRVGKRDKTRFLAENLRRDGYYFNVATFPAVSPERTGIRFTVTLHHSLEDIQNLIEAIASYLKEFDR